jgi:ABC-type transporter Mla subunit MlaD
MPPPDTFVDTGEVEETKTLLSHAVENIDKAVKAVIDGFNSVVSNINDLRWVIGPIPMYFIRNDLDDIRADVRNLVELAAKVVRESTPVFSLFLASVDWLRTVMSPTSEVGFDVNTPFDDDLASWTGSAATAYRQKAVAQKAAVDRAKENAKFISKWLFEIGKTNVAYAVELAKIVTDVAAKLAKLTIDALGVITIQFAVDELGNVVKGLVKAGLDQLLELANKFVATLGNVRDVLEKRIDHTEFENGQWPQAVHN